MAETKTDVVLLIAAIRREQPRNTKVMEAMDLLERAVVTTRKPVVSTVVTTDDAVVTTQCSGELCVRRRAAKSKAMKRWRSKRKPARASVMDEPVTDWKRTRAQSS
jgi:predicted transcriptional regulator